MISISGLRAAFNSLPLINGVIMKKVLIEEKENLAIIRLNNGVTNAVSSELIDDFAAALNEIKDSKDGMVLAGGEKFFCIGLNLPELVELDRPAMTDLMTRIEHLNLQLYTLPMITVCAIVGHAPAAGTVFALNCDYRFAADGKQMLGLPEIKLGLPVTYLMELILRQIVKNRDANDLLYQGEFINPTYAKEINLIDELWPQAEVEKKALEKVKSIADLPKQAIKAMKQTKTEEIRLRFNKNFTSYIEVFIDCWFSKDTRKLLDEAIEKF